MPARAAPGWQPWNMAALPRAAAAPDADPVQPPPRRDEAAARAIAQAREAAAAQGYSEGLARGLAEGRARGHDEALAAGAAAMRAQAEQLGTLAGAFAQALQRTDREIAGALTELALAIARQVVGRELASDPHAVTELVRGIVRQEPALQGDLRVLLHPADAALVEEAIGSELQRAGWQVRGDESIARGGCIVRSAEGTIDATIGTRWARTEAALRGPEG